MNSRAFFARVCASLVALLAVALAALPSSPARADAPGSSTSLVKGPYVTGLTPDSATIRFELQAPAPATVEIAAQDAGSAKPVRVQSPESAMHTVRLTGLAPSSAYAYAIKAGGARVAEGHLVTAPRLDSTAPMTFLVYGDERTDNDAHAAVVRAMQAVPADFLVNTGDMVSEGGKATDWQTFFDIEEPLLHGRARDLPLFVAIGDHELYDDAAAQNFARYFGFEGAGGPRPYGSVRMGDARFFFLNGEDAWGGAAGGAERTWLEQALSDADHEPDLRWRFAVVHDGPWSAGHHGPNLALRQAHIPELLAQHKVNLVFSGHDHMYERGDAGLLKYVISGGGGAPLYRDIHSTPTTRKAEATHHFVEVVLAGDALKMVTHRADGSNPRAMRLHPGPPLGLRSARRAVLRAAARARPRRRERRAGRQEQLLYGGRGSSALGCTRGRRARAGRGAWTAEARETKRDSLIPRAARRYASRQ